MRTANNGPEFDCPEYDGPGRSYVIASTPRSGSTLLARALWDTGRAGAPKEYFNPHHLEDFVERWGPLEPQEYLARLLRHRTGPGGVFGVKIHFHQLNDFFLARGLDPLELLPRPQFLMITRGDRLRQGISFYKAMCTGQWNLTTAEPLRDVAYDFEGIRHHMRRIASEEAQWRRWFRRRGITPREVAYEDLAGDYEGTVLAVLADLGADTRELEVAPSSLRVLRNEETEDWVARFQADEAAAAGRSTL